MSKRTKFLMGTMIAGMAAMSTFPALAQENDLATMEDNSSIVLSGSVAAVDDDEFTLDYGSGSIIVEMDDWDFFDDQPLLPGETVTVTGHIDDDLFEGREVEADTVYVHDRFTYHYRDPAAEPYFQAYTYRNGAEPGVTAGNNVPAETNNGVQDGSWVSATGIIEEVDDQEFTLDTGRGDIKVDTEMLGYNPMDEQGFRRLAQGDRVYVTGAMDDDFFEAREIQADAIVKLSQNRAVITGPDGTEGPQ